MKNNIEFIMGSKHGKFEQKVRLPKIPFKNNVLQKHKKINWKVFSSHFENIYASIGFMVS